MNRSNECSRLTRKYFHFLVHDYGFVYDQSQNRYTNEQISLFITCRDRLIPSVEVLCNSKPSFTRLDLAWLIFDYINYDEIDRNLLEDNFLYLSGVIDKHINLLLSLSEQQLLEGLKKFFVYFASGFLKAHRMTKQTYFSALPEKFKSMHNFILKYDPTWEPMHYI